MVTKPKSGDRIEVLIDFIVKTLGIQEWVFGRYPRWGEHVLVSVMPRLALLRGFTVERLEEHYLLPHELKYRPDPFDSTTALTSLVRTKKGARHVPMMDLDMPGRLVLMKERVAEARRVLVGPMWEGEGLKVLVFTGNSLHYYRVALITDDEWRTWMLAAREWPIVGMRYPTYRLKDGYSSLRVGTHPHRNPVAPIVADVWE